MRVPARLPGLRLATLLLLVAAVAWIAPEGNLPQTVALALALTLLLLSHGVQRWLGGKTLSPSRWLMVLAFLGLAAGLATGLLILSLMAVKTGLHGHGPEFSTEEVAWVLSRIPWWSAAGLLGGAGLGLLVLALPQR